MERLFEIRESLLRFYAKYSKYVDRIFQFIVVLLIFGFISSDIGFMKAASTPVVTLGLSVVCTFLPVTLVVFIVAALTVLQFYALSVGVAVVAAVMFLIMFIMYFRFAPGKAIIMLITPIAFMCKMPVLIPIIYGLTGTPVCVLPIAFVTVVCYMITYVKSYAATVAGAEKAEMMAQISTFIRQVFNNKEMWVAVAALTICLLLVYNMKRLSIDNSWKIAIVAGALSNIIVMTVGNLMMNIRTSYAALIIGSVVSVLIAMIVEFFVFAVDYSRTEHLQFEDDEYFYYVKAVPKVYVAAPEKTVKRINERQKTTAIKAQSITEEMLLEKALKDELEMEALLKDKFNF